MRVLELVARAFGASRGGHACTRHQKAAETRACDACLGVLAASRATSWRACQHAWPLDGAQLEARRPRAAVYMSHEPRTSLLARGTRALSAPEE
jgi:hypothetical protein